MTPEEWRRVRPILESALELDSANRTVFLDGACADPFLRREVESLIAAHELGGTGMLNGLAAPALVFNEEASFRLFSGRRVGVYEILGEIGHGGMGEVYRAHDSRLGRDVAIKTLPGEFVSDADRLARLRQEAHTLALLNHPNIAAIYDLEEADGINCLVLELVEGETLQGPLPVENALDYALQIAEALGAAHNKGIIHRDLKPANVKVTPEGRVKVLDFGLAKTVWGGEDRQHLSELSTVTASSTVAGQVFGTPSYMSPEQARGEAVDKRADIWAFGCLLYELLAGKRAFEDVGLPDTVVAVLKSEPDWSTLPPKTPTKIRNLLRQCLQKDVSRRPQDISSAREVIENVITSFHGIKHWQLVAATVTALIIISATILVSMRRVPGTSDRLEWVQLTQFPDAVSQPALSPDGRLLTFVRGEDTFVGPGQIYVKMLPEGEPVQLTRDSLPKMSPVFSPDGSMIAYTTMPADNQMDTWTVPVLGGQPRLWFPNASGLVWPEKGKILFSEIKDNIEHMAIVAAAESRAGERDIYVPADNLGMAHRSYPSPDAKWALVVEMERSAWLPCRLVPMDGSSAGRQVGPSAAGCTFAAWSPDGKWMYLSSNAGGGFHIWRQRFPEGQPEQVTSGPNEEEGIAMPTDGHSFITAAGMRQSSVWLHDSRGERQVSLEGYSFDAKFAPDGKKLCYRILKGALPTSDPSELRVLELDSGRTEALLPGVSVTGKWGVAYDISPDGKQVVVATIDHEGRQRLLLAPLDRRSAPYYIPHVEGQRPAFGPGGEIFFRAIEGTASYLYRVHQDGTGLRRVMQQPGNWPMGVSQDGQWLLARDVGVGARVSAYPLQSGSPVAILGDRPHYPGDPLVRWSPGGRALVISVPTAGLRATGRSYVIPLPRGMAFPQLPTGGFQSEADIARLPGARRIDAFDVAPGPTPEVYAFVNETVQRNLYRVRLH